MQYANIEKCRRFSEDKTAKLQSEFKKDLTNQNIALVTTGSFARGEASEHSDLDLFVIAKNNANEMLFEDKERVEDIVSRHIQKSVGDTGIFGSEAIETNESMLTNLGGNKDVNEKFTRRMLFLLESLPLYNPSLYRETKMKLINRYLKDLQEGQLARFMLNDFIRYYRTISTDFEFKVVEAGKSWGLRNIKLTFSRKLLYFAGVLAVAETHNLPLSEKAEKLMELFDLSPLRRIEALCRESADVALRNYDYFLGELSKEEVRKELDCDKVSTKGSLHVFRELKDMSKTFSYALEKTLKAVYPSDHPIHHALLF